MQAMPERMKRPQPCSPPTCNTSAAQGRRCQGNCLRGSTCLRAGPGWHHHRPHISGSCLSVVKEHLELTRHLPLHTRSCVLILHEPESTCKHSAKELMHSRLLMNTKKRAACSLWSWAMRLHVSCMWLETHKFPEGLKVRLCHISKAGQSRAAGMQAVWPHVQKIGVFDGDAR